ncbi:MAG: hypothetical protein GY835_12525 [bacterium]|nr:hypothetical protein [bacterium]
MTFQRIDRKIVTGPTVLLALLMLVGLGAVVMRMMNGLGATTNMSDVWPWGLWKSFNVMTLIALGAGGFSSAALIYIFGGEKYHGFARSAVLWGLMAYAFAGGSLMVDIGIPWRIVNPIWMWPEHSLLFEVAWCVMFYLTVLALELAPALFERFNLKGLESAWKALVPIYCIIGLSFFAYIMTHSLIWAVVILAFYGIVAAVLSRAGRKQSTPILLVMFGIVLSSLHQSTLGSLFLLVPDKLSHFWWSPRLPFNFLMSAVIIGLSVIVLERTIAPKVFGVPRQDELLAKLSRFIGSFLWLYLIFRILDVVVEGFSLAGTGHLTVAFGGPEKATMFVSEMFLGIAVPAVLLSIRACRNHVGARTFAVMLVIAGGIFNRLAVCFIGMNLPGEYVPSMIEILVTVGTVATMLLLFTLGAKLLPIYESRRDV